jgi:hypothetical protein
VAARESAVRADPPHLRGDVLHGEAQEIQTIHLLPGDDGDADGEQSFRDGGAAGAEGAVAVVDEHRQELRPRFGFWPWFAFLRRALAFFFCVRFDIAVLR